MKSIPGAFTNASYDASDRPTLRPNANGTSTTWSYDPERGWLGLIVTIRCPVCGSWGEGGADD